MDPVLPVAIELPRRGSRLLQRSLYEQLRNGIVDGRLAAGFRMPGTRTLADHVGVSRNCVVAVYDLLLSEGYVTARRGGGTYVADIGRTRRVEPPPLLARQMKERLAPYWRVDRPVIRFRPASEFAFDFAVGLPDKSEFPFAVWRRLSARALRALSRTPAAYVEPEGRAALRESIAKHVSFVRAVACSAADILVTSGAQQAFDLIARIFVVPGKTVVAVEEPGYPAMRWAFERQGARIAGVPVDEEGIVVDEIPRHARVVCVTPSHQFPMGPAMSARRRTALLEFAQRYGAVILEDDYDGEFRDAGRPVDALQTLDRSHSVFYVGTFSKSLFPALRLGFVVAPAWARNALTAAKQCSDWHGAVLAQDTLAAFIAEGHLARHVRKMRGIYAQRRRLLETALARHCRKALTVVSSEGGLHVTALLEAGRPDRHIAESAGDDGLRVAPLSRYAMAKTRPNGLVFGLGMVPAHRIDAGVARLARHLR